MLFNILFQSGELVNVRIVMVSSKTKSREEPGSDRTKRRAVVRLHHSSGTSKFTKYGLTSQFSFHRVGDVALFVCLVMHLLKFAAAG
jgi:hypothetical protein